MNVKFSIDRDLEDNLITMQANQRNETIQQIIKNIEDSNLHLECLNNQKRLFQPMSSFINIYSAAKKIFGNTNDYADLILKHRLYELETILPNYFVRVSNTEIININYVSKFELTANGIILIFFKNGTQTSSSRRYLKKIKEKLT
ncbi:LytTR family DNA-binding domain-containing protein [Vagococcus lutrae]|uniref:LytTR family DNA-binding domain-containing protein n=1 Tax=Vagococcus lutrae TaxID=81947 RepID=UPI001E152E41|nr:LytTR family DNA-binding domain-containing protein [Vagococcus lutrae]MDT2801520.1 LytTR family DNA-binding domain-containing protein [Vagococcus lutrae]GEQ61368.1 LytR family transcriptional regulator [Vagococcus lutrae]GEQ63403.1 LytR family transcriptional regulator [Vagococcus lutrae]GEQ65238.1 LytR family transcriptional regulator [Vagococcus lutrae]